MPKIPMLAVICLVLILPAYSQADEDNSNHAAKELVSRVAEEKIKYLQIDGKKVEVNWHLRVIQRGFYQSTWFLQRGEEAREERIATNVAAMSEVDDIKASANGKYLAVRSVGEGAWLLQVIDYTNINCKHNYFGKKI